MTVKKEKFKTQKQRFEEAARELECDESEEAFEDSLKRVVPSNRGSKGDEDSSGA